jgi:hypothetical protein
MKNILAIAFTALFTTAAYAQCRTTTITMPDGRMMTCTTCCYFGNCNTTCF